MLDSKTVKSTSVGHCEPGVCACLTKFTSQRDPFAGAALEIRGVGQEQVIGRDAGCLRLLRHGGRVEASSADQRRRYDSNGSANR